MAPSWRNGVNFTLLRRQGIAFETPAVYTSWYLLLLAKGRFTHECVSAQSAKREYTLIEHLFHCLNGARIAPIVYINKYTYIYAS